MPTGGCSAPDGQSVVLGTGKKHGEEEDPQYTGDAQIWQVAE